jgi:hypothetical protein
MDALSAKSSSVPPNALRKTSGPDDPLRSAHRPDRAVRGGRDVLGLRSRWPFNSASFAGGAMGDVEAPATVPSRRSARPKRVRPSPGLHLPIYHQAEPSGRERNATRPVPAPTHRCRVSPTRPHHPRDDREENQNDSARDDGSVALHFRHERPARSRRVARLRGAEKVTVTRKLGLGDVGH